MKFVKISQRAQPRVSLVLLDWGVRESFHLLHYLKQQTVSRDAFEVIVIENYDGVSQPLMQFEDQVDTYALLEMPQDCYYHKHLMYNAGIALARGDIIMIGDSDAMVRETFIATIIDRFDRDPSMAYHMDQFRNVRRDMYPFNYPSFDDVLGEGCVNNVGGRTSGVLDQEDPIHTRNFGACMCAKRADIIAIGGADEDMSYLGHVCGPYDLSFRLMHFSRRLVWETEEYMYHTWHPGSDGVDNYSGPHDGRNMSTTALAALTSGKVMPLKENAAIRRLREGQSLDLVSGADVDLLIDPAYRQAFNREHLGAVAAKAKVTEAREKPIYAHYRGFDVFQRDGIFLAAPVSMGDADIDDPAVRRDRRVASAESFGALKATLDAYEARLIDSIGACNLLQAGGRYVLTPQSLGPVYFYHPEERTRPELRWFDDLAEARAAGEKLATSQPSPAVSASGLAPIVAAIKANPATVPARALRRIRRMIANLAAS